MDTRRSISMLFLTAVVVCFVCSATMASDGLAGWWKFDEGSGSKAIDSSGNGFDGEIFGVTSWADGCVGSGALQITGGGVKIGDNALLRPAKLTVAMWFKLSGKQVPSARLFQKGKDNQETINLQGGEGGIGFSLATAPRENRGINTKKRFEIGKWYHITGVYDGSELRLYVNGKISNRETVGPLVLYAGDNLPLVIGNRYPDMARPFNGIIDDVRVYTRPLSDTEVWELYAWKGREPVVAALPEPADEATSVMPLQKLDWTAGKGASSHLVYLGTDEDKVGEATTSSSEFKGTVTSNSFNPGKLDFGGLYYWRVDEKTNAGIIKGDVWKFHVLSAKAGKPSPDPTLKNVSTDAKLSWTKSGLATSHELYFGTNLEKVKNAALSSKVYKGKFALGNESFDPGPLKEGKYYYWRVDEETSMGTAKGDVWSFRTKGGSLVLQVDLAIKTCDKKKFYPGVAKPGWTIWAADAWTDMYMHDYQVFPLKADGSGLDEGGINGTGVTLWMTTGNEGQLGIGVKGVCRDNLAGGGCPSGVAEGDPIANSWAYGVDWVGPYAGDLLLVIRGLPAGVYQLNSYHNFWEPCTQKTRNCLDCVCGMPPMPSVTANPLPGKLVSLDANGVPLPGKQNYKAMLPEGTGKGVVSIQNAYNVAPQHVYKDSELVPSVIKFSTDGSDVLVIYQADRTEPLYPDCARKGREGARGILNAFELIQMQ